MRLDQELVRRGLCVSRQEAQECIEQSFVRVDNVVVTKKTRLVQEDTKIEVLQTRKFVSRGGDKLEGAILHIYPTAGKNIFNHKNALDVGSSTGGFTDCLLSYGITTVTCVDVGTSQLHHSLRNTSQVILFENTDIRDFKTQELFDVIVADVSFISLEKIIESIFSFGKEGSEYFLLIKPQFEVGFGNTKKGIVKDEELVDVILNKYKALLLERRLQDIKIFPCNLRGGDGNQEYFIYAKQKKH